MGEFLILPKPFVDYVARFKQIPIPLGDHLESLQSAIELVCLEVSMDISEDMNRPDPGPASG